MEKCKTCKYYGDSDFCTHFNHNHCVFRTISCEAYKPKNDAVSHPAHYTSGSIECIDCIKAALRENFIGFLIGNVLKYCYRYRNKNGLEDLKKAAWYLDRAIKEIEDEAK